jgi:hypothetical protein
MAKRNEGQKAGSGSDAGSATSGGKADAVERQVVALAEQLGRFVGTVQAKAEGWMDRDALRAQISNVRDSAADLLQQLAGGTTNEAAPATTAGKPDAAPKGAAGKTGAAAKAMGRSGGVVDAPGKRHRKPLANTRRPKVTDSRLTSAADARVAKMKIANASRRHGRG